MFMNLEGGIDVPVDVPKFVSSLFQTEKFLHHCFHTPQGFHSVFGGSGSKNPAPWGKRGILVVARKGAEGAPLHPLSFVTYRVAHIPGGRVGGRQFKHQSPQEFDTSPKSRV